MVRRKESTQINLQRLSDLAVDSALAGFADFMIGWWLTESTSWRRWNWTRNRPSAF